MGLLSIMKTMGQELASVTRKAFRDPIKRVQRRAIKTMLKSNSMYNMQNAVFRLVTSEILLAVIVALVSVVTARGEDAHVYNFVLPCVISGTCTQFLREPLNNFCDDYTQPIAQRTQKFIADNWSNESLWLGIKHATGIILGIVVIGLSAVNDTEYVVILVTQTLLTSFVVGLIKNPRHPLKIRTVRCIRQCRDRPRTRMHQRMPTLLENSMVRSDSDNKLVMRSLVTREMLETTKFELSGVQRIKDIRRRRSAVAGARILKVTEEQDFQEDVGELASDESDNESETESETTGGEEHIQIIGALKHETGQPAARQLEQSHFEQNPIEHAIRPADVVFEWRVI